ncbi:MAG: glycoside hydrolase family 9 protein [Ruminococcus sp.]|nr:glycoside hydrolase family 9 protein [Oscillospiraceae bacterium]MDY4413607.1 glycoside hydrolase family 9 protein [Ruminococcus sp.]
MDIKKIIAGVSSLAMLATAVPAVNNSGVSANAESSKYNYAEALQKSMFFYEVQQAGILPEWNNVSWRADSMVKEDGTPADIVDGGWFDAGDHYKFTLTNAYTASVLAWGYIQYKDAVDKAGLGETYRNNIQWGLDYVMNCDKGDKVIGTIGDADDHVVWCSAEVYMRKHKLKFDDEERPYDEITDSTTVALSAAALAEGYIIFKDSDPDKAAEYLKHAKSLFELADKTRSNDDQGVQKQFYPTTTWVDDLMYAANWLYMATGDQKYLDLCESDYIPNFPTENQSTDKKYTWGFCWDDTTQGAALLYAINTGKKEWIDHISHHLDYWIDGYGGKQVAYTPDGLAYLMNWGSLRHAANTVWISEIACDTIFAGDSAKVDKYSKWAKSQIDYMFGDNGLEMSYVLGMGDKQPTAFHHRTASGIHDDHWNDLGQESSTEGWQTEYAHTLYGALVGGPNSQGEYTNNVSQYEYSEVAIDYNAGFTASLCAFIDEYGGEILADFPPTETPKWAEWEVAATLNGHGDSYTEIKAWAMNHTAWPARVAENVSYNYYFDVSEILDAGLSVDDITVKSNSQQYQEGQQGYATVSGPYKYEGDPSGNTYYAKIQFLDGRAIMPTGQSEHRDEVQFRISIPDAVNGQSTKGAWNPENDWSYKGVADAPNDLKSESALNDHITMYVDDVLVWGVEPDGTTPSVTEPTKPSATTQPSSSTSGEILWGDANVDNSVDIADAVCIASYVGDPDGNVLSAQGLKNADVQSNGNGVNASDALAIQQYLANVVKSLPID